jgi:hypothetical protein
MDEPSIHARLEALRHLGGWMGKKDYTCNLKIEWSEKTTASQGGRVSGSSTENKKEFVVVKWNQGNGNFKAALAKIRGKSQWSELTYNNIPYFTQKKDELEILQTTLENETERGTLFLRVGDVSTFHQQY